MPFKVYSARERVMTTDFNALVMRQVIAQVTSGTRPTSPPEGQVIYQTDLNTYAWWNGMTWAPLTGAALLVTSTARPTAPGPGQIIYETDTGSLLIYSGAWKYVSGAIIDQAGVAHPGRIFYGPTTFTPASPREGDILLRY